MSRAPRNVAREQAADLWPVDRSDRGVYVHFPYCAKKCPYCDFNSHAIARDDRRYATALLAELESRGRNLDFGTLRSIYIGGGTPSLFLSTELARVLEGLRARFGIAHPCEVTLEANPGTVATLDDFPRWVDAGINRFSIGVQSFVDDELRFLGRIHDAASAALAVKRARATGAIVSLDLIHSLPEQRWDTLLLSIDRAIDLGPEHISAYALSIEPNTAFGRARVAPMPEDRQAEFYARVEEALERAGYVHYEVSSFARASKWAIHNTLYWAGAYYLGLGAGAHSHLPIEIDGARRSLRRENVRAPDAFVTGAEAGHFPASFEEILEDGEILGERMIIGVRTRFGLNLDELASDLGIRDLAKRLGPAIDGLVRQGLVAHEGTCIRPTARGFLMNDHVARVLYDAVTDGAHPTICLS